MREKLEQIKKANELLLKKVEELEKAFTEKPLMNEKEAEKYFRINESLNATQYKEKIENEIKTFKLKLFNEISCLTSENINLFIKKLVNNYAKIEDGYYALLGTYNNPEMSASVLFRSECLIDYLKENIKTIVENCDKINYLSDEKTL